MYQLQQRFGEVLILAAAMWCQIYDATHLIVPLVSKLMHRLLIVTGYKGGGCCTNSESISSESTLWQQGANYSRSAGARNTNLCSLG